MNIDLITPHDKQKDIINSCLDKDIFFIVAIIGRQFGKTIISENMAIYWALNNSHTKTYWVSPTDSQAQKVYKEIKEALIDSGAIKSSKAPKGDTEIIFKNGSKILFRSAASEDSLRGESVHYMILDEAAFIKKETIDSILMPMLNVTGRKCLFISTPKGKNYLYDFYKKGLSEKKWKSIRYSTYDSPFANDELIDMFRNTLPDKLFKQEIEAQFIDSSSIFNNLNDVMILDKEEPNASKNYYGGIDIGIVNDATVLTVLDDNGNMVNYYRWEKLESPEIISEIIRLNKKWNFKKILIENNNQGLPIYQELKRKINNIKDFNTNVKTKSEIINRIIYLFNMKEMKVLKDEYLRIELEGFIFKQSNGNIKFMADNGFHDDCVMSLAIARRCFEKFQNAGKVPFMV